MRTKLGVAATAGTAAAYLIYAGKAWWQYGNGERRSKIPSLSVLDRFMPHYDVGDRHKIRVSAPTGLTLRTARETDLDQSMIVRAVFRGREILLGGEPSQEELPRGIVAVTQSLGWGILADIPEHEVVLGAATQPWVANPIFRTIPAEQFATFKEPGYVKIVWNLKVEPVGPSETILSTETRAIGTDAAARDKFRPYWALLSPGILIIRWAMLRVSRREAEKTAQAPRAPAEILEIRRGRP